MAPEKLVPFRWPSDWTDGALLRLIVGSPINCLLLDDAGSLKPVAGNARQSGLTVLDWNSLSAAPLAEVKWDTPALQRVIKDLVWPRMKLSPRGGPNEAQAGPTGAPWIDSNAWVAHLARVRNPGKTPWFSFEPDRDSLAPDAAAYTTAVADSAAAGARWIVTLDKDLRQGLPAGNADALKTWQSLLRMVAFFEEHRDWALQEPWGSLGILSSFAGEHEFLGQEILNLSARRNLHYRVLDRAAAPGRALDRVRAVLYVDAAAPTPGWKSSLTAFARRGGLLVVPHLLAADFPGDGDAQTPVAGYRMRTFGKGRVATALRDWDDPYSLAQDVHSLVSRRSDPVRLFNAGSLWEHYSESADGRQAVLQLVGFSSRPYNSVSLAPLRPWPSAAVFVPGRSGSELRPVKVDGQLEYHLPTFSLYAALEFRS